MTPKEHKYWGMPTQRRQSSFRAAERFTQKASWLSLSSRWQPSNSDYCGKEFWNDSWRKPSDPCWSQRTRRFGSCLCDLAAGWKPGEWTREECEQMLEGPLVAWADGIQLSPGRPSLGIRSHQSQNPSQLEVLKFAKHLVFALAVLSPGCTKKSPGRVLNLPVPRFYWLNPNLWVGSWHQPMIPMWLGTYVHISHLNLIVGLYSWQTVQFTNVKTEVQQGKLAQDTPLASCSRNPNLGLSDSTQIHGQLLVYFFKDFFRNTFSLS